MKKSAKMSCLGAMLMGAFWAMADKPNVIMILVDDMGYSDIGCYGGEIETPNLDRLAAGGIRFTQMHNTSKCYPSRATLLTGVYAQQNGMSIGYQKFSNAVTLGEVLKGAGYRTLASGKHHSRESLFDRGFDRYFGLLDGCSNHFNPGLKRDGEVTPARKNAHRGWAIDGQKLAPYTPVEKDFYSTDAYTQKAIDYLEEYKDEESPFFLYLAYTAPHDPLQAWPEDIAKYKGRYDAGYEKVRAARYSKMKRLGLVDETSALSAPTHDAWDSVSARDQKIDARRMEIYAAMIDRMDQGVGRVLNKLEALGELDNTLIMFAADNGSSSQLVEPKLHKGALAGIDVPLDVMGTMGYFASLGKNWANVSNTPFRYYKTSSYEGGVCTPFIAYWPNEIKDAGSINKEFVGHFIDVMATLVELTGATYPTEFGGETITPMQGHSFLAQLKGGTSEPRNEPIFWEWKKGTAIREGKWKAVAQGNSWALFDMSQDRSETNDLSKQYPEVLQQMKAKYTAWYASTPVGQKKGKKKR